MHRVHAGVCCFLKPAHESRPSLENHGKRTSSHGVKSVITSDEWLRHPEISVFCNDRIARITQIHFEVLFHRLDDCGNDSRLVPALAGIDVQRIAIRESSTLERPCCSPDREFRCLHAAVDLARCWVLVLERVRKTGKLGRDHRPCNVESHRTDWHSRKNLGLCGARGLCRLSPRTGRGIYPDHKRTKCPVLS